MQNVAGKAVDDFDLHSDDSQSRAEFQWLVGEQHTAALELIEYIAAHAEQLRHTSATSTSSLELLYKPAKQPSIGRMVRNKPRRRRGF